MHRNGASQVLLVVKNPGDNAEEVREVSWILGSGRSPGRGHGNPLSLFLAWRIEKPVRLQSKGPQS